MKNTLLALYMLCTSVAYGQLSLVKVPVENTGCVVLLPTSDVGFEKAIAYDSSEVYTASVSYDATEFKVICIKLKEPIPDHADQLTRLNNCFGELKMGYDTLVISGEIVEDIKLLNNPTVSGINPGYWTDANLITTKARGWVNSSYIIILSISGREEFADSTTVEQFLNGITMPE